MSSTRREEILEAAERIFANKGFHESGIADIAQELGIGHGTFYRYFKNKQDIAQTVLDRVVDRIAEAGLQEDPEATNSLDEYRAQVERILNRMLSLVDSHPSLMRFFHDRSLSIDGERIATALDTYARFTARFLENGVKKGFLRANLDTRCTSEALVALIFEGTRRALKGDQERRRWVDAGIALMFDGIRAR